MVHERTERAMNEALRWMDEPFDTATRQRVTAVMKAGGSGIVDRFGGELEFGTAGLRGLLDVGTLRMNEYTVARAARGMAGYLRNHGGEIAGTGVVVGYDCRHRGREFAEIVCAELLESGLPVYLFDRLVTTPLVPYALRKVHAALGIMVTSSHNPPAYNGLKVFAANGAQIISPTDRRIADEMSGCDYAMTPARMSRGRFSHASLTPLSDDMVDDYVTWAASLVDGRSLGSATVLYTPCGGTGWAFARRVFRNAGFSKIHVVEEEAAPDPDFAGLPGPNPELPEAWVRSLERAQTLKPDLIVATDGDGDRIGVAIPDGGGGYRVLTGNQIGSLALYYLCLRRQPLWTGSEFACASIVSSPLARKIIEGFGGQFHETLTGFKWMGNLIERKEAEGAFPLMAYEEAFGMSFGGARDKDGVTGVALFAEMACWCASQGLTMDNLLDRLFVRYGIHLEQGAERCYEGIEGVDIMRERMGQLRRVPPLELAGSPVTEILDMAQLTRTCGGETTAVTHLPRQDLFMVRAADRSWMALRPSGTEPKIKAYLGVVYPTSEHRLQDDKTAARNRLNDITAWAEQQIFG